MERKDEMRKGAIRTVVCTVAALLTGGAASAVLSCAYALINGFSGLSAGVRSSLPAALLGLYLLFFVLEALAAGALASGFEHGGNGFLPHIAGLAVFGASFGFGYLITGRISAATAIFSVCFYISGFLLFRARRKGYGKKTCVLFAAVPAMALAALTFVLRSMEICGFALASVGTYIGKIEEACRVVGRDLLDTILALYGVRGEEMLRGLFGVNASQVEKELADLYGITLAAYIKILPALAAAALNIYGFIAASLVNRAGEKRRTKDEWYLEISGVGTLIFIASTFISTIFVSLYDAGAFGVLIISLRLIFLPAMLGIGVRTLTSLKKDMIRQHPIMAALTLLLILVQPLVTVSLIGAYGNTAKRMAEKIKKFKEEHPSYDGSDDDQDGDDHHDDRNG